MHNNHHPVVRTHAIVSVTLLLFWFRRKWFMASLYANIILSPIHRGPPPPCRSHSFGKRSVRVPILYIMCVGIQITSAEKKQHRPRTVTRTNTRACIIRINIIMYMYKNACIYATRRKNEKKLLRLFRNPTRICVYFFSGFMYVQQYTSCIYIIQKHPNIWAFISGCKNSPPPLRNFSYPDNKLGTIIHTTSAFHFPIFFFISFLSLLLYANKFHRLRVAKKRRKTLRRYWCLSFSPFLQTGRIF